MVQYTYTPLRKGTEGKEEFRIITLHSGLVDDDIRIQIEVHVIQGDTDRVNRGTLAPQAQWESLSYTWGSRDRDRTIFVADKTGQDTELAISENLFDALRYLRRHDTDRNLWVDAICIDQGDTTQAEEEKSSAIQAMHGVYLLASNIVVWIGKEKDDSDNALAVMECLGGGWNYDWATHQLIPEETQSQELVTFLENWSTFAYTSTQRTAVCALFSREFFERSWPLQEISAASDACKIICGSASISVKKFRNAVQVMAARGFDVRHPKHEHDMARLKLVNSLFDRRRLSVVGIMTRVRNTQCLRPSDKVHASLGLIGMSAGRDFADSIGGDRSSIAELFKDFFFKYCMHYQSISLLLEGGLCQASRFRAPSWVPDWTTTIHRLGWSLECASCHAVATRPAFLNVRSSLALLVAGIVVARIIRIANLGETGNIFAEQKSSSYVELQTLIRENHVHQHQRSWTTFMRALSSPLRSRLLPHGITEAICRDFEIYCRAILETGSIDEHCAVEHPGSLWDFQNCIRFYQRSKLPFVFTDGGDVGIGADGTRVGDMAAVVLGCSRILLLREPPTEQWVESHYLLIGTSFIHGLNWGEALVGPLPPNYIIVTSPHEAKESERIGYLELETGECVAWDPRIFWGDLAIDCVEDSSTISLSTHISALGVMKYRFPDADYFIKRHRTKLCYFGLI